MKKRAEDFQRLDNLRDAFSPVPQRFLDAIHAALDKCTQEPNIKAEKRSGVKRIVHRLLSYVQRRNKK